MNHIRVELLKQIRDRVDHLGDSLGRRMDRLGEGVDHLETSLCKHLDGTDHRLNRVEHALSALSKFVRQYARSQARQVEHSKVRVAKLEKRRGS
jgi:hypothetical protein